jgi:CRISPR-associated protein Csd2
MLENKYDFVVVISVKNANPNGDPLNGNRPRMNYDGFGEISDVCIKRKIRNRLLQKGKNIFVQSDDYKVDEYESLRDRAEKTLPKEVFKDKKALYESACSEWIDVRAFGQVFAFKGGEGKGVSVGVRGPVSIQTAFSVSPINVTSTQITKSVNSEGDGNKKSSDTMGMKHRVDFGIYTFAGSINPQLAFKTGLNEEDVEVIRESLVELFEDDASSARPEGSMEVVKVFWWKHNSPNGQYSAAKVHKSVQISLKEDVEVAKQVEDYSIIVTPLENLEMLELEGK